MKKIVYETPWAESLPLVAEQPICGVSGGDYTGSSSGYDDDSD